ncbi:MAG: flagellar assembly protein FliX [Alphaproteobacteria bacterium]|nr:flagellar assembly protein FliX [Alphaproteobacteria bacterium]
MINKIGYTNPTNPTQRTNNVRRTSKTGSSSFVDALDGVGEVEEAQATTPVAAMSGIGVLLGAQEVSEEEVRRRKAFKQGKLTLDALAELRDALIIGNLPLSTIRNLESIVAQERGTTNDPVLNGILDEIELRAAVEIAKLEAAGVRL